LSRQPALSRAHIRISRRCLSCGRARLSCATSLSEVRRRWGVPTPPKAPTAFLSQSRGAGGRELAAWQEAAGSTSSQQAVRLLRRVRACRRRRPRPCCACSPVVVCVVRAWLDEAQASWIQCAFARFAERAFPFVSANSSRNQERDWLQACDAHQRTA
jgi:hypothetical protein